MGNRNRHHFGRIAATRTFTFAPTASAARTPPHSASHTGINASVSHPTSTSAPWYSSQATTSPSSTAPTRRCCSCVREASLTCLSALRGMPSVETASAISSESRAAGRSSFHRSRGTCSSLFTPTYFRAPPSTALTISWSGRASHPPSSTHCVLVSYSFGGPTGFSTNQCPASLPVYGFTRNGFSADPSCGMRATASSSRPSSVSFSTCAAAASAAITPGNDVMVWYSGSSSVSASCSSGVSTPSSFQGASMNTGSSSRPRNTKGSSSPSFTVSASSFLSFASQSAAYRALSARDRPW